MTSLTIAVMVSLSTVGSALLTGAAAIGRREILGGGGAGGMGGRYFLIAISPFNSSNTIISGSNKQGPLCVSKISERHVSIISLSGKANLFLSFLIRNICL